MEKEIGEKDMDNSMENVKEIRSIRRTTRMESDARERFRYLNASHRNSNRNTYKNLNRASSYKSNTRPAKDKYVEYDNTFNENENKSTNVEKSFKRLMVSTGFVAFVLAVKLMDNGFTNKLEGGITNLIRTSSEFDNKISSQIVSLTEKMGININGINVVEDSTGIESNETTLNKDNTNEKGLIVDDLNQIKPEEVGVEAKEPENFNVENKTDSEVISEDQVSDFYIDDSVFEEIKGDSKK